ncbi:thioredoxin family protein [Thermodesulfobacteriota bacterium]
MKCKANINFRPVILFRLFIAVMAVFFISSCENYSSRKDRTSEVESTVGIIKSEVQFVNIIETSKERLLMFEMYADWCAPCRVLAPVVEEIARENADSVTVYKINTEENKALAASLRIPGLPFVLFMKNKEAMHSMLGLYPKDAYVRAIEHFSKVSG